MLANVIGVKCPPWMEVDQWCRLWHRTGNQRIGKCKRVLCLAGHVGRMDDLWTCAKALGVGDCSGGNGGSSNAKMWRRTSGLVRTQNDAKFRDGRTWRQRRSPSFLKMQTASFVRKVVAARSGSWAMATVCKIWAKPSLDVVNVMRQWRCTSCLVGPGAPGKLVGRSLLMASFGVKWWSWLRVASMAVERWIQVVQNERENEREEFDVYLVPFSLLRIRNASDSMSSWWSAGRGWSEPFDSKNGRRRGSWKKCSEDEWYCLSDVQC